MGTMAHSAGIREEIEARLRARKEVLLGLLFGSRASAAGTHHHGSGGTSLPEIRGLRVPAE